MIDHFHHHRLGNPGTHSARYESDSRGVKAEIRHIGRAALKEFRPSEPGQRAIGRRPQVSVTRAHKVVDQGADRIVNRDGKFAPPAAFGFFDDDVIAGASDLRPMQPRFGKAQASIDCNHETFSHPIRLRLQFLPDDRKHFVGDLWPDGCFFALNLQISRRIHDREFSIDCFVHDKREQFQFAKSGRKLGISPRFLFDLGAAPSGIFKDDLAREKSGRVNFILDKESPQIAPLRQVNPLRSLARRVARPNKAINPAPTVAAVAVVIVADARQKLCLDPVQLLRHFVSLVGIGFADGRLYVLAIRVTRAKLNVNEGRLLSLVTAQNHRGAPSVATCSNFANRNRHFPSDYAAQFGTVLPLLVALGCRFDSCTVQFFAAL
jgi:hypothetical protein